MAYFTCQNLFVEVLEWSPSYRFETRTLRANPERPGLYKILDLQTDQLLYVGETQNLRSRMNAHRRRFRRFPEARYAYTVVDERLLPHQRRELETDLLGSHDTQFQKPPLFQYERTQE